MKLKLLICLIATFLVSTSWATVVSVQPATQLISPGQSFSLNIEASNITDLYAFQFDLAFDPSILSAALITEGSFLPSGGTTIFVPGIIDNVGGVIYFSADSLDGAIPGVNGNGILATVQFTAIATGSSYVNISNDLFLDSNIGTISTTTIGGTVNVNGVPEPATIGLLLIGLALNALYRRKTNEIIYRIRGTS